MRRSVHYFWRTMPLMLAFLTDIMSGNTSVNSIDPVDPVEIPKDPGGVAHLKEVAYLWLRLALLCYVTLALIDGWHLYLEADSPIIDTRLGDWWYAIGGSSAGYLSFKDLPFLLLFLALHLSCLKSLCKSLIKLDDGGRLMPTRMRIYSRLSFLQVPLWRSRFCVCFALFMTALFLVTCYDGCFFEYWLFPAMLGGSLLSGRVWVWNPIIFWLLTALLWFGFAHYLLHLFDILSEGLGDEASRLTFRKNRWWNRKIF
jgi:hypothetical protein